MGRERRGSVWRWTARPVRRGARAGWKHLADGAKLIGFGYFPVPWSYLFPDQEPVPEPESVVEDDHDRGHLLVELEAPLLPAELRAWRDLERVLRETP
jgi:hypothetical protein